MPDEYGTPEMFETPTPYTPRQTGPKSGPVWRRWSSKKDPGCQLCRKDIVMGRRTSVAEPAKYVRTDGDEKLFVCYRHHEILLEQERSRGDV